MNEHTSGELYLGDQQPPELSSFENLDEEAGALELFSADTSSSEHTVFDRVIFKYQDPTSLPHTKKKCSKWAYPLPGTKICVGWTMKYRWLYRIGRIRVTTMDESAAKKALEDCIKQGAIAAIIAGVASGGSAAAIAAEVAIKACLAAKIGDKLIAISVDVKSSRGDWE